MRRAQPTPPAGTSSSANDGRRRTSRSTGRCHPCRAKSASRVHPRCNRTNSSSPFCFVVRLACRAKHARPAGPGMVRQASRRAESLAPGFYQQHLLLSAPSMQAAGTVAIRSLFVETWPGQRVGWGERSEPQHFPTATALGFAGLPQPTALNHTQYSRAVRAGAPRQLW